MTIKNYKILSLTLFSLGIALLMPLSSMAQKVKSPEIGDEAPNTKGTKIDALPKIINDKGEEETLDIKSFKTEGQKSQVSTTMGKTGTAHSSIIQTEARKYATEKTGENPHFGASKFASDAYNKAYAEGMEKISREYEIRRQKMLGMEQAAKSFGIEIENKTYGEKSYENFLEDLNDAVRKGKLNTTQLEEIKKAGEQAVSEVEKNPYAGMSEVVFTDSLKRTYKVEIKNGRFGEITYEGKDEGKEAFRGCEVLPAKLYKQRECFFCPLFAEVYRAADTMAVKSMSALASSFAILIALGLGIWIAFQTLTHVSSLTKQDAPKFLGNLVKQSFKFLIAFLLLQYTNEIYNWVVIPLLKAGLDFGSAMLFESHLYQTVGSNENTEIVMKTIFFSSDLYEKLENFVTNVQREIAFMQAIGTTLMCIGSNLMIGIGGKEWEFGGGFQMLSQGLILAIFGFLLSLAFAFYLIDAVVQLGIVGALMPFLIACWPFKLTAQYSNKGFSMLLNSFFIFVFVGLVVSVNLQLIDAALVNGNTNQVSEVLTTQGQGQGQANQIEKIKTGALGGIYEAINAQDENKLLELTDIGGVGFLILLFCCIFGFKFCGQSSALADKMAGGGMKAIAPSIATMGASATLSAAKKVSQPMREAVADKVTEIGGNAARRLGAALTGRGGRHGQRPSGGDKDGEETDNNQPETPASDGDNGGNAGTVNSKGSRTLGQKGGRTRSTQGNIPSRSGATPSKDGTVHSDGGSESETQAGRQREARQNLEKTREKPRRAKGNGGRGKGGSRKGNKKTAKKGKKRK